MANLGHWAAEALCREKARAGQAGEQAQPYECWKCKRHLAAQFSIAWAIRVGGMVGLSSDTCHRSQTGEGM